MNSDNVQAPTAPAQKQEVDLGKAKKSCKHCFGSGVYGRMVLTGQKVICSCVWKALAQEEEFLKKASA